MFSKMPGGSNRVELNKLLINYLCYYDEENERARLYKKFVNGLIFAESKNWINKSIVLGEVALIASYKSLRLSARHQSTGFVMGWLMNPVSKRKIIEQVEFLERHDVWSILDNNSVFSVIAFMDTALEPPPFCTQHFDLVRMHFI